MVYIDKKQVLRHIEECYEQAPLDINGRQLVAAFKAYIENIPTADVISIEAYNQCKWERDTAIEQLKSYGVGFCENKELAEVKHGYWKPTKIPAYFGGVIYECSLCGAKDGDHTKVLGRYCWRCGAKMDGERSDT